MSLPENNLTRNELDSEILVLTGQDNLAIFRFIGVF